ncbi:uncharacterized protein LOC123534524 [Mercenaria mercenaria]|uniref:uncharacterized protein LOC123534524 n=1 Tax=Mercenaria mercenaria TaxID=6596 RepID=UPI00234F2137|nr:uncharacterized protein LOC123534524 [Mercenaria mercenaria]
MSFGAGAAIFNSCNKPGSIVEFTNYLRINPNEYNALMWRAKAYGIVGQPQNALRDVEHAISVSSGIKKEIALCNKVLYTTGSIEELGVCASRAVDRYPNEWTAWNQLGSYYSNKGDEETARRCWVKSLDLATKYNETRDPEICWVNYSIGNYDMERGDVGSAKRYYKAAVESSPTHTVSHIGLCRCNICQGMLQEARGNFQTAESLNPNLASATFQTGNFDEYRSRLLQNASSRRPSSSASRLAGGRDSGGAAGGTGGGSGGGGNGSDDDDDVSAVWKQLQKESPCIKMYGKHKYVQSKCGKYWYSRDTARHGGAQFKRYEDTRSTLVFKDSVDANLRPLTGKHESRSGTTIRKSDMIGVKGK